MVGEQRFDRCKVRQKKIEHEEAGTEGFECVVVVVVVVVKVRGR